MEDENFGLNETEEEKMFELLKEEGILAEDGSELKE